MKSTDTPKGNLKASPVSGTSLTRRSSNAAPFFSGSGESSQQLGEFASLDRSRFDLLLVIVVAASIFFFNLGGARLWDRDEPRNAGCAWEMQQRQDWVTPIFNDELRGQKPVLLYWLIMSAYQVFGVNEFAARFWSALFGVGTVVLTYVMGRRMFGASIARWSALVLCSTLMFGVASRAATPDASLIFFSTLAICLFVLYSFPTSTTVASNTHQSLETSQPASPHYFGIQFPRLWGALAIYAAMAVGVLAKGPIAFVLPTAIMAWFLLSERIARQSQSPATINFDRVWLSQNLRAFLNPMTFAKTLWQMRLGYLLVLLVLIPTPWFVWAGLRTNGDFLLRFFLDEHLGRASSAMENHSGGWWYYPAAILVGFFPWSILAVPAMLTVFRVWRQPLLRDTSEPATSARLQRAGIRLMLFWVILQVAVFTVVRTKLPSYVTPCYPALAVLMGITLQSIAAGELRIRKFWLQGAIVCLGLVGIGLISVVSVSAGLLPTPFQGFSLGMLYALASIPLLCAIVCAYRVYHNQITNIPKTLAWGSICFCIALLGMGTQIVDSQRQTDPLWAEIKSRLNDQSKIASYRCLESSWVYYLQQPIWELAPQADATQVNAVVLQPTRVSFANSHQEPLPQRVDPFQRQQAWQRKANPTVAHLVQHYPDSVIITTSEHLTQLLSELPQDYREVYRCPQFLKRGDLVLVARD